MTSTTDRLNEIRERHQKHDAEAGFVSQSNCHRDRGYLLSTLDAVEKEREELRQELDGAHITASHFKHQLEAATARLASVEKVVEATRQFVSLPLPKELQYAVWHGEQQRTLTMIDAALASLPPSGEGRKGDDALGKIIAGEWNDLQRLLANTPGDFVPQKVEWLQAQLSAAAAREAGLREALEGVVRVADRKTVEFDAARAALSTPQPATPQTPTPPDSGAGGEVERLREADPLQLDGKLTDRGERLMNWTSLNYSASPEIMLAVRLVRRLSAAAESAATQEEKP